ncbi:MAG: xylulokinase [Bacilli bacterium]
MRECVLTIDLGSTACKAVLFSGTGATLATASVSYPTWHPDHVRAEQHPDDWWQATTKAVRRAMEEACERGSIHVAMIALTSQRETLLPLDRGGRPLHSAMLWMDTRGVERVREAVYDRGYPIREWTGLVPSASYFAGKIHWLNRHHPDIAERTAVYVQPKDYMLYRMSGVLATDRSLASRTLLYNIITQDWQEELLEFFGVARSGLPEVYPSNACVARVKAETAAEWGIAEHTPILLGGGDRQCEVLGSGIEHGEVMEATGTTSNIACAVDNPAQYASDRMTCSAHVLENEWILEQGMSTTGAVVDWLHSLIAAGNDFPGIDDAIQKSSPGASGLIAFPFFMGARAPRWNPNAQGAILGLTLSHRREDIYRAILEGVSYELRYAIQTYEQIGVPVRRIRLIGGGARLKSWNQLKADIYRKRLASPKIVHAAAFGAFLLAAREMEWISSYEQGQKMNPVMAIYHPDLKNTDLYEAGYQTYTQLYDLLDSGNIWSILNRYRDQSM